MLSVVMIQTMKMHQKRKTLALGWVAVLLTDRHLTYLQPTLTCWMLHRQSCRNLIILPRLVFLHQLKIQLLTLDCPHLKNFPYPLKRYRVHHVIHPRTCLALQQTSLLVPLPNIGRYRGYSTNPDPSIHWPVLNRVPHSFKFHWFPVKRPHLPS